MIPVLVAATLLAPSVDTLRIPALTMRPAVDGRIDAGEYGEPVISLRAGAGVVRVRLGHHDGALFVAAEIPDSTSYWGDDLVVAVDLDGSGGSAPGAGDRLWILRRVADSSVVVIAAGNGRWEPAGGARSLGATRGGPGWTAGTSDAGSRWVAELRIDLPPDAPGSPRLAIRTFNDAPGPSWVAWPQPAGVPAQRVERVPDHWVPILRASATPASR